MTIAETQLRLLHQIWPYVRWTFTRRPNGHYELRRDNAGAMPYIVRTRGLTAAQAVEKAMYSAMRDLQVGRRLRILDGAA